MKEVRVPRNHQTIPRPDRVAAVVDSAAQLFVQHGFESVKMADIAAKTGIKSGALYWYFDSKDHLLAAVLGRLVKDEVARLEELPSNVEPADRFIRFLTDLSPTRALHAAAHARMANSEAVTEAHTTLIYTLRTLAAAALDNTQSPEDRELTIDAIVAAFEGANIPGPWENNPLEIVEFLLQRFNA
ncbi:hypothetical protein B2J88_42520 [Rhodococcus sp. SRB_17]|nr:hypothetical protein [Rhodococcus sp. SRB_17]